MNDASGLLPGTLDLLILKAVSLGKLHGYGVLLRIQQISGGARRFNRVHCIPRSTGSSSRGGLTASGASPTTTGAPSSTG